MPLRPLRKIKLPAATEAKAQSWLNDIDTRLSEEIACERFPAQASLRPLYDPRSERVKL